MYLTNIVFPEYKKDYCKSIVRQSDFKMAKVHFTNGDLWIASKWLKRCQTSVFFRGMQIKKQYYLHFHNTNYWHGCIGTRTLIVLLGM